MAAYSKTYLDDAMSMLGGMFDYAVHFCGQDVQEFFERFLVSKASQLIASGNVRYLCGMSGSEVAMKVLEDTGARLCEAPEYIRGGASAEFWAGWALAYYQWHSGRSFCALADDGLDMSKLLSLYSPLHEADITKFVDIADKLCSQQVDSPLRKARVAAGLAQRELAEASEVSIRMIRAYEQGTQDLSKAEAGTVMRLARTLGIPFDTLLGL